MGSFFLLGPNLERDVLPNGLDPVGDELVDDVPRIISPFSYTTCVCVWMLCEIISNVSNNYCAS